MVIPTYNEKETLEQLVRKIFALKIPNLKIVVVDDNSPDNTAAIAEDLSKKFPVTVIRRNQKLGAGSACVHAFKKLLGETDETQPEYIIQMDADFSHDPEFIPAFLERINSCDAVIGSRYIKGGKVGNEPVFRKILSRLANLYIKAILQLPYRDATGGFKCYRRNILKKLNLDSLNPIGYIFQIETNYQLHKLGARVSEIPIFFSPRKNGESKLKAGIILKSFFRILALKFRE